VLAAWVRGRLAGTDNDPETALIEFRKAHLLALEHGLDRLAASSAASLGFHLCESKSDYEGSEHYLNVALALAKASGSKRTLAGVYGDLVTLRMQQSRFEDAVLASEQQLQFARASEHPDPMGVALGYTNLAQAIRHRDGPKASLSVLAEASEHILSQLGDAHPILVHLHREQATVARELGDYEQAYTYAMLTLEHARTAYGEGSLDEAYELANLATVIGSLGKRPQALRMLQEADATIAREQGETHPVRAAVQNNIGAMYAEFDDWGEAAAAFSSALRIAKANSDEPSELQLRLHRNLAHAYIFLDRLDDAKRHAEAALAFGRALHGETHMTHALSLLAVGQIAHLDGEYATARTVLKQALEIGHDTPASLALIRFRLGAVLVEDPGSAAADRTRGLALVREAESTLAQETGVEGTLQDVRDWLATHDTAD
jgi:tetratricopeptide (TPR) repeat protein